MLQQVSIIRITANVKKKMNQVDPEGDLNADCFCKCNTRSTLILRSHYLSASVQATDARIIIIKTGVDSFCISN